MTRKNERTGNASESKKQRGKLVPTMLKQGFESLKRKLGHTLKEKLIRQTDLTEEGRMKTVSTLMEHVNDIIR